MSEKTFEDTYWMEIRRRAELLAGQPPPGVDRFEGYALSRLIDEIQVNQIEMEMEIEALTKSRDAIAADKTKYEKLYRDYARLFNSAPIGHLIVDRDGVIQEINPSAAASLNAPGSTLAGRCITDFIHGDDQPGFYYQKLNCHRNHKTAAFEMKMKKADGWCFDARLQMQAISNPCALESRYSIALMDISGHVQLSSGYALQQDCLKLGYRANDVGELLDAYVKLLKSYLGCCAVGIRIRDDTEEIPYVAYDGFSSAFFESECQLSLDTDRCMCTTVINGTTDPDMPFFTENGSFYINGPAHLEGLMPEGDRFMTRNVCHVYGYDSVALMPITMGNTVEGLIHVADRRENTFPLRVVETLEDVASLLGMTLQRFYLQKRLNKSVGALNHLSSHLLTVQEDEQRRIAMELHDGCGQDMNVLRLHLKTIQQRLPADAIELKKECYQLFIYSGKIINNIRRIAHDLKPAALDVLGLTAAARQMIREFSIYSKIPVEAKMDCLDRVVDPKVQVSLFRIFQEALTNVHKHARATWVLISASHIGRSIVIQIRDNGVGFDARRQVDRDAGLKGMGLSAMALRCRMIGAELSIASEPGKGTRLAISLAHPDPTVLQ